MARERARAIPHLRAVSGEPRQGLPAVRAAQDRVGVVPVVRLYLLVGAMAAPRVMFLMGRPVLWDRERVGVVIGVARVRRVASEWF